MTKCRPDYIRRGYQCFCSLADGNEDLILKKDRRNSHGAGAHEGDSRSHNQQ